MADWNCNLCKEYQSRVACTYCDDGSEFVRMSNADRIRAMSDEELAEWLTKITDDAQLDARTKCNYQWAYWLQSETE